jgi:hypothetical protein
MHVNGFNQLFKGGEAAIRSNVAHSIHENVGRVQQGGISLIMFGTLVEQLTSDESGKDKSGLGRRAIMTLQGTDVHTRIICAYNPCGNNKLNSGTTYQHQRRYLLSAKDNLTCLWEHFQEDLVKQLSKWRSKGD